MPDDNVLGVGAGNNASTAATAIAPFGLCYPFRRGNALYAPPRPHTYEPTAWPAVLDDLELAARTPTASPACR